MSKRNKCKGILFFICLVILSCGCGSGSTGQDQPEELEFVGLNAAPELTYEVPVSAPHILVDQVGYLTDGEKTAVFKGSKLPENFEVIHVETGEVVYNGTIRESQKTNEEGELVGYGDFTELTGDGTYYIQSGMLGRSYNFSIGDHVYDGVFADAMAVFKETRSQKISPSLPEEGGKEGEDTLSREKLLQGGWYTDSDGNQEVAAACETMMVLLTAYELYPSAFGEAVTGASEPELLSLLRSQTEWLLLMQNEGDGGVYEGVFESGVQGEPEYRLGGTDPVATACFAAAMAKFSYVYQGYDQQYASTCLRAADRAWKYINRLQYGDEKDILDQPQLSGILFSAAAELYRASGQQGYHSAARQYLKEGVNPGESHWDTYGAITYLSTKQYVNKEYCGIIMKQLMTYAEDISVNARGGIYFTEGNENLDNTKVLLWNMVILAVADYVITNHEYATVIENHQHYFWGCNTKAVCLAETADRDEGWGAREGIQDDLFTNACYVCMMSHILKTEE